LPRLHDAYPHTQAPVKSDTARLLLIGRRSVRSNNSWMHNTPRLMARRPEHHLLVHPEDLTRHNIADGDEVILQTAMAEVSVVAKASSDMMEGVVCLPHGWDHRGPGMRLGVAASLPGANFNALVDERMIDVPSAGSVVQGIPVTLRPRTR
jgi:anaerobic selenocysteine-containing dehydrogenase